MARTALYTRGDYTLYRRDDRPNLEIVWYDRGRRRERSRSAGTSRLEHGRLALDRLYLGERCCPTCGRPLEAEAAPLLADAIADYLLLKGTKSARNRLSHVLTYIAGKETRVEQVTPEWVDAFREWMLARPVKIGKTGKTRPRSLSHVEGCLLQLSAVINATPGQRARFKFQQPDEVSNSPTFRADVPLLAKMFKHALEREDRANLLAYLRLGVATWARPDALHDVKGGQWVSAAGVLNLNPKGRRQTKKYRPFVPVAKQLHADLDRLGADEQWLPINSIRQAWDAMREKLEFEGGPKLIRRTMATLGRARLGEANWQQGRMMLGHVKADTSDIYALPDPANLGLALRVTEEIIDEIEALVPEAFTALLPQGPYRNKPLSN